MSRMNDLNEVVDEASQTVTAGTTGAAIPIKRAGAVVTAIPGGGGSMTVQWTSSTQAQVDANTANWNTWPAGAVAATTSDTLVGRVTAVRASAAVANGTLEVSQ